MFRKCQRWDYKLSDIKNDNIDVELIIKLPTSDLNIEDIDITAILGNLIDNALTATKKTKSKWVKLYIKHDKGILTINTKNSFDGIVQYKDDAKTFRNIVSRKSGDLHGYGLKSVKSVIEKYNGSIDVTHEDNVFNVDIMLFAS